MVWALNLLAQNLPTKIANPIVEFWADLYREPPSSALSLRSNLYGTSRVQGPDRRPTKYISMRLRCQVSASLNLSSSTYVESSATSRFRIVHLHLTTGFLSKQLCFKWFIRCERPELVSVSELLSCKDRTSAQLT